MASCCDTVVPLYVAVSVVVPTLIPVTTPVFEIVATVVSSICHVTRDVTFSTVELVAGTTLAVYCDVAPTPGGEPIIDSDVIVVDGSVGVLQAALMTSDDTATMKAILARISLS